jgi:hypothetical protein
MDQFGFLVCFVCIVNIGEGEDGMIRKEGIKRGEKVEEGKE